LPFRGLEEPRKLTYFNSLNTEQSAEQRAAIAAMDDKTAFKIDRLVLQRPFSSTTTASNEQKWHFGGDFLKDAGV
jgi:hypothetical protein